MILGIAISLVFFFGFIFLSMPIYGALLAALAAMIYLANVPEAMVVSIAFNAVTAYVLIAVPLFLYMGDLMGVGGLSVRLVKLAHALVGRIKGGLAHVMVVTCMFFGLLTGSAVATTAAIGSIMIPRMEEYGWSRSYASALVACSSPLGYLIPPSILAIIYGFVTGVSVGRLFLASVVPGVILGTGYMAVNYFWGVKYYRPTKAQIVAVEDKGRLKEIGKAAYVALPALIAPLVILGGIYGGVFTPTEAAAIGVAYALIVGFLVYRELKVKSALQTALNSAVINAATLIMLVPMSPYVDTLIRSGVGKAFTAFILGVSDNPYVILLMLNILLLILGMIIDPIPILLALVPLLLPLIKEMGYDPVHIGNMILVNVGFGVMTPPFAASLFVAARVGNVPFTSLVKPAFMFLLFAGLPTLLLTTYVPQLSLWLPNLVMGPGR
ncbi:MAG: TRAP transporter large permease [Chloroflexi bacterium]|nr:TRAP transporter large permease [Chloroflexota bacterium]